MNAVTQASQAGPPAPADEEAPPAPVLSPEAALVQASIAQGTLFIDTFTMQQAADAWNATRTPLVDNAGKVLVPAERYHHTLDAAWFAAHTGDFTLRRLSMYDSANLRVRVAQLGKGAVLGEDTNEILTGMAVCELFLTKKPDWFDLMAVGADLEDAIKLVLYWHIEWGASFRSKSGRVA